MGKGKRLKAARRDHSAGMVGQTARYSPGLLNVDPATIEKIVSGIDDNAIPTLGLASFYLAAAPMRHANQCLLASSILMLAMRAYGVQANLVAVELVIPAANNVQGMRYGSPTPALDSTALTGHVALLTDDRFLDPTAYQFPEIRKAMGSARPLVGALGIEGAEHAFHHGANVGITLAEGTQVNYRIYPVGSADGVGAQFMSMEPNATELPHHVMNIVNTYTSLIAQVRPDVQTRFPRFNSILARVRGTRA